MDGLRFGPSRSVLLTSSSEGKASRVLQPAKLFALVVSVGALVLLARIFSISRQLAQGEAKRWERHSAREESSTSQGSLDHRAAQKEAPGASLAEPGGGRAEAKSLGKGMEDPDPLLKSVGALSRVGAGSMVGQGQGWERGRELERTRGDSRMAGKAGISVGEKGKVVLQGGVEEKSLLRSPSPLTPPLKRSSTSKRALKVLPPWLPMPEKYLLVWCHLYGSTNRMYCHEKALILAALLNRTAVVPQLDVCANTPQDNSFHLMVDVAHARSCLMRANLGDGAADRATLLMSTGPGTTLLEAHVEAARVYGVGPWVISLEEYLVLHPKRKFEVDVLMCEGTEWYGACPPASCNAAGYVLFPSPTPAPVFLFNGTVPLTLDRIRALSKLTAHIDALSLGDTFYGNVVGYLFDERVSLAPMFDAPCGNVFQPSKTIFDLASDFVKTELRSSRFGAVHLRRQDFQSWCGRNRKCSVWTIEQAAQCVGEKMLQANLSTLFVASDANAEELKRFQSFLRGFRVGVVLFKPAMRRSPFESSLVEKVVAAHADLFVYQDRSTFSFHILQLRDGLGTATRADEMLCKGRKEGFPALGLPKSGTNSTDSSKQ